MPVWAGWVPRIFIPSPERSVIVPLPAKFRPMYSTAHGLAGRLLGFDVPRFDTGAPPYSAIGNFENKTSIFHAGFHDIFVV